MRQAIGFVGAGLLVATLVVLAGCGSTSVSDGVVADHGGSLKIVEYVGDGHGGTKPLLFPLAESPVPSAVVTPQAGATLLNYGANYTYTNVAAKAINWYYLPKLTAAATVLVTMQPAHSKDADLYLLNGRGNLNDGMECVAYSNRSPGSGVDVPAAGGWAPDWAAYASAASDDWPAAYVACYGYPGDTGARYFRLEADLVEALTVNGATLNGSLGVGQSAWYVFPATTGLACRVGIAALSGDPDIYIYNGNADGFVQMLTGTGSAYSGFTATATASHYVRVYAASTCTYGIRVLQP